MFNVKRDRKMYGKVFRDVIIMLHGFGIPANKIEIERVPDAPGTRVRWDVIVHDKVFFEELTIEEITSALRGLEMSKILVRDAVKHNRLDVDVLDEQPSEREISAAIAHSFDREYADLIVPTAANRNEAAVQRAAASQSEAPDREKNPRRVEAGRRAAARRWNPEPANA